MVKSLISASSNLKEMRICSFPTIGHLPKQSALVELVKTNDSLSFNYDGMKYVGTVDDKVKYRLTLHSKKTKTKEFTFLVTLSHLNLNIKLDECEPVDDTNGKESISQIHSTKRNKENNENPNLKIELRDQLKTMRYDYNSEEKKSKSLMTQLEKNSYMTVVNVVDGAGKVYLSQIAPQTVLDSLKVKANSLLKDTNSLSELKENDKLHDSVMELVVQLGKEDVQKMSMCLLLEHLLRFSKLHVKEIRSRKPLHDCPNVVTQYLLTNYTTEQCTDVGKPSQIVVTKDEKDKLFQVVLAIFTYLWSYKFPVAKFQTEMRCSTDRLRKSFAMFKMRLVAPANRVNSAAVARKEFVATSSSKFIVEHDQ